MKTIGKMFYVVCFLIGISPLLMTRSIASEPKDSHTRVRLVGDDLSAWQGDTGDWQVAGEVFIKPDNEKKLAAKPGTGIIWNGPKGKTKHLTTKAEFGDVRAHIEFLLCEDSNSGVYFAGQYELQIFDNWQTRSFHSGIECGGIYQRWDTERKPRGFEGHSPRVDASFPSGRWQAFDVVFRAARFDRNGRKTANAKFIKVFHNGILIHENVELNGPTRGSMFAEERPRGPLLFQGNHGPVAFRNVWVAPIDEPDFFVFDSAIRRKELTAKQGVQLIRESGYDGMEYERYEGITEIIEELDKNGLRLYALYLGVQLDRNKPKYDPRLKETIELLKGRDVTLWLNIRSRKLKCSDPAGDARAVEIIREIDDMVAGKGFRIALYPHHKFWLERVEDSVRVTKKVDRKNVGAIFNLCHWLKAEGGKDMKLLIETAMPYLFSVSINGAEHTGGWEKIIQPLDSGEYDVYAFLETLKKTGYSGHIGLQTYGITVPARDHLARSMKKWRQFVRRLMSKTK